MGAGLNLMAMVLSGFAMGSIARAVLLSARSGND